MTMSQIFISYRRDDAAGYARLVYDELARRFGAERVFIDVDDIGAGLPFSQVIERAVGGSQVLLVLIGSRWRGVREDGSARIDDPADLVRQEVAAGLAQGLRVIPVLLEGAAMPSAAQLPDALKPLTERNAIELGNTRYAADMQRLLDALGELLGESAPARGWRRAVPWAAAAAALLVAGVVLWQTGGPGIGGPAGGAASAASAAAVPARAAVNGEWEADVTYDWPGARYVERFNFKGEGSDLYGTASFLGGPQGVLEGSVAPEGLSFITKTRQSMGNESRDTVHRYRGRLVGDEIRFVMQTEGAFTSHVPVEFVARRTHPN